MDLLPTEEQTDIVESVTSVLSARHEIGDRASTDLIAAAVEQGWFLLGVPEASGGVGYGICEEMLVHQELGRHGVAGAFIATSVAAAMAAHASDADLVARIGQGDALCAFGKKWDDESFVIIEHDSASLWLIDVDGELRLVEPTSVTEIDGLDVNVPIGLAKRSELESARSMLRSTTHWDHGSLLVSAQLSGNALATTAQSVSYGNDRQQFGQPIGGFQAVKHRCADMITRAEAAQWQTAYAAVSLANGLANAGFHVAAARSIAVRAAIENAQTNIQNHGGIGFTWEHTAHRYVTRARVYSHLFSNSAVNTESLLTVA